jgi:hypothetical protein
MAQRDANSKMLNNCQYQFASNDDSESPLTLGFWIANAPQGLALCSIRTSNTHPHLPHIVSDGDCCLQMWGKPMSKAT